VFCPDDGTALSPEADADEADVSPLERQIDRYRLLRHVGQGASSDVFEAEHVHIGKRVALKLLRPELACDPRAVERLRREARSASAIGHRNIVHVDDFGVTADGEVYIALEWLEGETLAERIERGPLAQAQAIDVALQIGAGLGAAHDAGVIHRDLKPANVFLVSQPGRRPLVKLLDFGIAKQVQSESTLTRTGSFVGTPDYIAPEQALGDDVDPRADLYALGVVLYQLLTGTLPFRAPSFMVVLHRHTTEPPEPPSLRAPARAISPAIEAVVLRCLAKRPEERFASAEELVAALSAAGRVAPAHAAAARDEPVEPRARAAGARPESPVASLDSPVASRHASRPESPVASRLERPVASRNASRLESPGASRLEAPIEDALEERVLAPRRGRLALRLALLVMVGGAIGAALALGSRSQRARTTTAAGTAVDAGAAASRGPGHDDSPATPSAPPAPAAPTASSTAAPSATAPSTSARGPSGAGVWKIPGRADGFDYTVWVKPRSVRPGKPFTIVVEILPGQPLARSWQRGAVTARLAFLHYRGHRVELRGEFPLDDRDRLSAGLTLAHAGKHHVQLSLADASDELGRAEFDLCVGADPTGSRADLERVCPRMAKISRLR
jgi:serine/threonine protein kinase